MSGNFCDAGWVQKPGKPLNRPDRIADEAWQKALILALEFVPDALRGTHIPINECIARAIVQAQAEAIDAAAKVADEWKLLDHPRLSPGSEINAWWSGQEKAAQEVASGIRALSPFHVVSNS